MSDLVVVRCPDKARHVLLRVRRTPRGLEVVISTDLKPESRAKLQRAVSGFLERAGRPRKAPAPPVKWSRMPWGEFVDFDKSPLSPFCRCQALIELDVEWIAGEVEAAQATGRTRTVRATYA